MLLAGKNTILPDEQSLVGAESAYTPSTTAYFQAKFESGFEYTTTKLAQIELMEAGREQTPISKEEWTESYSRPGIEYEDGMTKARAEVYAEEYDKRQARSLIIESAKPNALEATAGFGLMLLGNLPDPVNFIPYAGLLGKGGKAAKTFMVGEDLLGQAGKTALQGGVTGTGKALVKPTAKRLLARGAVEGAIGTAAADAIVLPALAERGEDVGFTDAMLDITFGAILGGGLHYTGAKLGERADRRRAQKELGAKQTEVKTVRALATPEDRKVMLAAQDLAVHDFVESGQVNVKEVFEGTNTLSKSEYNRLVAAVEHNENADVNFGKLREDYKEALNAIRAEEGVSLIVDDNLVVPARVVKKLHEKRMLEEGLSADRVAEILLNVFHEKADFATATKIPHIQALVNTKLKKEFVEIGFIAIDPKTGQTIIRTGYLKLKNKLGESLGIDEGALWGNAEHSPSEKLGGAPPHLPAPRLSALQSAPFEKKIIYLNREVNFSAEQPEVFARAAELSPERRSAFEEAGIDPETKMSLEEARLEIMKEDGSLAPEDIADIETIKNAETKIEQVEEAGLSVISCILEASE